jgi:uncharacterized surface protein with fasciclin (FAS1) repeats
MTSASGYYPYLDLVQTYSVGDLRYLPQKPHVYQKDTVAGFLRDQGDFTIFLYLLKIAKMDAIADQQQYHTTLFACPDSILRAQFGGDDFFMNLDRGSIVNLMNLHMIPRVIHLPTLRSRKLSILSTRHNDSKLTFINNGETTPMLINGAGNNGSCRIISGEIERSNGMIYAIDNLLLPENF